METISSRLKEALIIRNMKPIELSNKSGIDKGSISLYLNGKYTPKSKKIYKMAEVLNVNPSWLLGYDVPMEILEKKNIEINDLMFKMTIIEMLRSKKISIPPTKSIADIKPQKWKLVLEGRENFTLEEMQRICDYFGINNFMEINDGSLYEKLINNNNGSYFSELLKKYFNETELNDINNKNEIVSITPKDINISPIDFVDKTDLIHQSAILEDILYSILVENKLVSLGKRINNKELEKIKEYINDNIDYINKEINSRKKN